MKYIQTFNEMITSQDMKNNLDLGIEKTDAKPVDPNAPLPKNTAIQKDANLKITDIQARINQINQQKALINQEIVKLQGAQRDLAPNNPNDPQNAEKLKVFTKDQQEKIDIQTQKVKILDQEIKNLQAEVARHQQNYL